MFLPKLEVSNLPHLVCVRKYKIIFHDVVCVVPDQSIKDEDERDVVLVLTNLIIRI